MRAIRKRVGKPAEVIDHPTLAYEMWQETVGGYVQMVPIGPDVDVICNEEGMYAGPGGTPLPQNVAGFLGDILIIATDQDGETRGLSDEEVRKGLAYLAAFAQVEHSLSTESFLICGERQIKDFLRAKAEATTNLWESL